MQKTLSHFCVFFIFIMLFLTNCKRKTYEEIVSPVQKKVFVKKEKPKVNFLKNELYGVYRISQNDYAAVIPTWFDTESEDSISLKFSKILAKDSLPWIYHKKLGKYSYHDSTGTEKLLYSDDFDYEFRKSFKKAYYVFGKNGKIRTSIKKIVFTSNECDTNYIALILDLDKSAIDSPFLASDKDIPLRFEKSPAIDQEIINVHGKDATENNYGFNKYRPRTVAKLDNYYFSVYDDYQWFSKKYKGGIQFPERLIVRKDKDSLRIVWNNEMDLLGLPCL